MPTDKPTSKTKPRRPKMPRAERRAFVENLVARIVASIIPAQQARP